MARTATQGPDILAQDIQRIALILRRAQANTSRPTKENAELVDCLKRAIAILAGGADSKENSRRKTG